MNDKEIRKLYEQVKIINSKLEMKKVNMKFTKRSVRREMLKEYKKLLREKKNLIKKFIISDYKTLNKGKKIDGKSIYEQKLIIFDLFEEIEQEV